MKKRHRRLPFRRGGATVGVMSARTLASVAALLALLAASSSALAARQHEATALPKGSLIVTFRGSGSDSYRFHQPQAGAGIACHGADTTYAENDLYRWSYRFVLPPGGGSDDAPVALAGGGQITAVQRTQACAGAPELASSCSELLRPPLPAAAAELAYPGIVVGTAGRSITVGAVGELIPAPPCSGVAPLFPNPVQGYAQLQASVVIPRAALALNGDVTRRFTMAGAGLYAGVALAGSCDGAGCDTKNCAVDLPAGPAPNSCSYAAGYSGTIEVRLVR